MDLVRERFDYPRLKQNALKLAEKFKPSVILIEDASTGSPLAQELRQAGTFAVRLIPVEHDKVARLYVQQAKFEAGQIFFPRRASYLAALEAELLTFPQTNTTTKLTALRKLWRLKLRNIGMILRSRGWVSEHPERHPV